MGEGGREGGRERASDLVDLQAVGHDELQVVLLYGHSVSFSACVSLSLSPVPLAVLSCKTWTTTPSRREEDSSAGAPTAHRATERETGERGGGISSPRRTSSQMKKTPDGIPQK